MTDFTDLGHIERLAIIEDYPGLRDYIEQMDDQRRATTLAHAGIALAERWNDLAEGSGMTKERIAAAVLEERTTNGDAESPTTNQTTQKN